MLRWENARLSLKLRSVDGASLVRDVQTNLWHFDVERTPYTGNATENFDNGDLEQKRLFSMVKEMGYFAIGMRTESLNPKVNGLRKRRWLFRQWNEDGRLLKAVKYKSGELIEVLKN